MERLTKIDKYGHPYTNENVNCRNLISEDGINYQFIEYENGVNAYDGKPIEKLSKLEDIEQELGIPLEVLFKALKDGIWCLTKEDGVEFMNVPKLFNYNDKYYFREDMFWFEPIVELKDYGKTWWIEEPKEELENAKD